MYLIVALSVMMVLTFIVTTSNARRSTRSIKTLAWTIAHRDERYKQILITLICEMIEQGREVKAVSLLNDPALVEVKNIILTTSGTMLCPNCEEKIIPMHQDVCRICSYKRNIDRKQLERMVKEGAIKEVQHA